VNVRTFYRAVLWLPLAVPAAVMAAKNLFNWPIDSSPVVLLAFQILAFSLVYGGIPYFMLAVWGSVALKNKSEPDIERLMHRAPLLMAILVLPFYLAVGSWLAVAARSPSPLGSFLAVGVLGAVTAIPVGYTYVGVVRILRRVLGQHLRSITQY
jgi:hypothetical protein